MLTRTLQTMYHFMLSLRCLLRKYNASAVVTIPAHTLRLSLGDAIIRRLEHAADSVIELESFADKPELAASFPRYSGLIHVRALPSLNSLVPASTKMSVLRGLAAGSGATTGAGGMENNLAFRLKRRRFVIETLHLDVEGGTSERKVPASAPTAVSEVEGQDAEESSKKTGSLKPRGSRAAAGTKQSTSSTDW